MENITSVLKLVFGNHRDYRHLVFTLNIYFKLSLYRSQKIISINVLDSFSLKCRFNEEEILFI